MVEKTEKIDKNKKMNDIITDLSKKGESKANIGHKLKEEKLYPKKQTGKKISKVQEELNLDKQEIPEDLMYLIRKAVKLIKHKDNFKKDMTSKRGYQLTVSKINRLRKYYIKQGRLPNTWRYSEKTAKLLVK